MGLEFQKKILRVNLTTGGVQSESVPDNYVRMFVGGRALGDRILFDELAPGIEPLSPENKLIFSAGPLTGTKVPGSSRYIVHTKSPLTGLYLCSLAGGYFGPELRKTGYEMLIIEGRSERPVYLVISDDKVEIQDAAPFWGMTTLDTQKFMKKKLGDSDFKIACIGPAGENQGIVFLNRV